MKKLITCIALFILSGCAAFTNNAPKLPDTLTRENLIKTITQKNHYFETDDKSQIFLAYYFDGEDVFITVNENWKNEKQLRYANGTVFIHERAEFGEVPGNVGITKLYKSTTPGYTSKYGKLYTSIIKGKLELTHGDSTSFILKLNSGDIFMRYDVKLENGKLILVDEVNVSYTLK